MSCSEESAIAPLVNGQVEALLSQEEGVNGGNHPAEDAHGEGVHAAKENGEKPSVDSASNLSAKKTVAEKFDSFAKNIPTFDATTAKRKSVRATLYMLQGSWLPLLTDKIHNNVRSRVVMATVYLFIAALVMALIVLTVWTPTVPTYDMKWIMSPPASFEFGYAMKPFSVKVTMNGHEPVVGLQIFISFAVLSTVDVNVTAFDQQEGFSHSVDCVMNQLFQIGQITDEPLCNLMWSRANTSTNKDGVAVFSVETVPMIMPYGTPGEYLIVAAPNDQFTALEGVYLTSVAEGTATVFNSSITSNVTWEDIMDMETGELFFSTDEADTYAFTAEATFRSQKKPDVIAGGIVPISLLGPVTSPLPRYVPYTTNQANRGRSYVVMQNFLQKATTITHLGNDVYRAMFNFNNVTFVGSDSNQVYLGFNFLGRTTPLIITPFSSQHQSPNEIYLPYGFNSVVGSITVMKEDRFSVAEGGELNIRVLVADHHGNPLPGKIVFLRSLVTGNANPSAKYGNGPLHPGVWTKSLLFGETQTDKSGVASFITARFSVDGGIGVYTLTAVCDGVQGLWEASDALQTSAFALVNVESSVDWENVFPCTRDSCANDTSVILGEPWQYTPQVKLLDRDGSPIPGKKAALLAVNPNQTGVTAEPLASDNDGWARFDTVISSFATTEGLHAFNVMVDGRVVLTIERFVHYPANHHALLGKCAYVQLLEIPKLQYSGRKAYYTVRSVDIAGREAPHTFVVVLLPKNLVPPQPGQNISYNVLETDARGLWSNFSLSTHIAASYTMIFHMMCHKGVWQSLPVSSAGALPYLPRVTSISNPPNTGGSSYIDGVLTSWLELELDADWDTINEDDPLYISAAVGWGPSCMTIFGVPDVPVITVTKKERVKLFMNYSSPANRRFTGTYTFFAIVDGAALLPPQLMTVPTIAAKVELLQAGWIASEVEPGVPFKHVPKVRVLDSSGNPVHGVQLGAQLGQAFPNGTCCRWLFPTEDADDLVIATLSVVGAREVVRGNGFPTAAPTDENGETNFQGLNVPGTAGGVTLGLRYCVVNNLLTNISSDTYIDGVCVQEPALVSVPTLAGSTATVTPTLVASVPGAFIPALTITSIQGNKVPNYVSVCNAEQVSPPPIYLRRQTHTDLDNGTAYSRAGIAQFLNRDFFYALTSDMTVANLFYFATGTPDGDYKIRFRCVGAITQDVTVQITSKVTSISPVVTPPEVMALSRTYRYAVLVSSVSGIPLTGVNVGLEQASTDSRCHFSSCGELAQSSTTFAETDSFGYATFTISYDAAAANSVHVLKAAIAPKVSSVAIRQRCAGYFLQVSHALGGSGKHLDDLVFNTGTTPEQKAYAASALKVIKQLSTTASVSVDAASSSFSGYVAYVKSLAENPMGSLESHREEHMHAEVKVKLENSVGEGQIQIVRPLTFNIEIKTLSLVSQFTGHWWATPDNSEVPIIKVVLNDSSTPMVGETVTCDVLPEGSEGVIQLENSVTDLNGELELKNLRIYAPKKGKYSLYFSVRGGGGIATEEFEVTEGQLLTFKELLTYLAFMLVGILSPVLLSSVPHTSSVWLIISAIVGSVLLGMAIALVVLQKEHFHYVQSTFVLYFYEWFLVLVTFFLAGSTLFIAIAGMLSRNARIKRFRMFDDETKSEEMFTYSKWLLQVRVDTQLKPAPKRSIGTTIVGLKDKFSNKVASGYESSINKLNTELAEEMFAPGSQNRKKRRRSEVEPDRTLSYHEVSDAVYMPINYVIVSAILVVIFCFITMFMYYVYQRMINGIDKLIGFLPHPDTNKGVRVEVANEAFVLAVTNAINLIVAMVPQYSFLSAWIGPLRHTNIIGFLDSIASFLTDTKNVLTMCFSIGTFCASTAVIVTAVLFAFAIPKDIRAIRRGQLQLTAGVGPSEGYIGLHCMHFVLLHQLILWPVVLVCFILAVGPIRIFLWNTLSVIIVASVGSALTQMAIQKVLVGWYLSDGFYVIRPEAYSIWHFFGFILGIFSGIAKTISRYVQSIVFMTILFARIDQSVFPDMFKPMDVAALGYRSMVVVEAKNGNPHAQLFAAWMLLEYSLKRFATTPLATNNYTVAYDASDSGEAVVGTVDGDIQQDLDDVEAGMAKSSPDNNKELPPKTIFGLGEVPTLIDIDRFPFSKLVQVSNPGIRNLMALALRMMVCNRTIGLKGPLCRRTERYISLASFADIDGREAKERIRNRWWLLWILHKNPSLRKLRKHALYVEDDERLEEEREALRKAGNVNWESDDE